MTPSPGSAQRTAAPQAPVAMVIVAFLIAATLPYMWLIENFGYDDILREPASLILAKFAQGGSSLVLAWFAFAMASLLFVPVALGMQHLLGGQGAADRGVAMLGVASAIVQAIGLLRWVLVVPALAATFTHADSSPATRDAVLVVFDAVHRYGGMVAGEMLGQLLLAAWTAGTAWQLLRSHLLPRWLALLGALTVPLWLLGQTELLHGVVAGMPVFDLIPLAFMGWEAWLACIAAVLLFRAWKHQQLVRPAELTALPH